MSTDAAFLAAVATSPDDALPRLVYADWLDEQGDPRGEMVRVMEEMRKHPVWADAYQKLRPARNRLWQTLDAGWLEAMGYQKVYRPLFGKLPETREHRWRLAEEFIDIWHGGLKEGDGYSDAEIAEAEVQIGYTLPSALREWHQLAGKRRDVWSNWGELFSPSGLVRDGKNLVIRSAHYGVTHWFIGGEDLRQVDPPVYLNHHSHRWADSVSAFALLVLLAESWERNIGCELSIQDDDGTELPQRYQCAELPGCDQHRYPERLWEAADCVIRFDGTSWYAICRTEAAYQELVRDFGHLVQRNV